MEVTVIDNNTPIKKSSENFRFSAAVAGFGMLLQNSDYKNNFTFDDVIDLPNKPRITIRKGIGKSLSDWLKVPPY